LKTGPKISKDVDLEKAVPPYPISRNISDLGLFAAPEGYQGVSIGSFAV